jgi:hypothetical protein
MKRLICGAGCLNWARPVLRGVGLQFVRKGPAYSPHFANMKVMWRVGNPQNVMRNGEAVLQSGPVYSSLLGLSRKEREIFPFFGEEHLGSKLF